MHNLQILLMQIPKLKVEDITLTQHIGELTAFIDSSGSQWYLNPEKLNEKNSKDSMQIQNRQKLKTYLTFYNFPSEQAQKNKKKLPISTTHSSKTHRPSWSINPHCKCLC